MNRPKPISIVCIALFAGIILSFSFFFGIGAIAERPSDTDAGASNMSFERFSNAYYGHTELGELAATIDHILFGSIGSSDIILGENNFLFDAGSAENGYNYLRDYIGNAAFLDSELEAIANILLLRQRAYKNQGVEYLLVVIPNSQTVYSDYMPSYMGEISENTLLSQLTEYISERGYDFYFDATDMLTKAAAGDTLLYNNTENSLNSLGEWYIYDSVFNIVSEKYGTRGSRMDVSKFEMYTRSTEGKELARRAGLASVIQNQTVSLANSNQTQYTSQSYYGSMTKTVGGDGYFVSGGEKNSILLEFTDEWDKIQLMPYFSSSFYEVTYKSNHQFSRLAVDDLNPDVVVQFIHEYELYDIMDSNTMLTYSAGLDWAIDENITSSPLLISQCMIDEHTACIAGEAEYNALMKVSIDGVPVKQEYAIGDLFFLSVDLGERESVSVTVTAQVNGKTESEPIKIRLYRDPDAKPKKVTVGSNSQLYSTDYSWINFLSDTQIEAVREGLSHRISKVKDISGKDTEYIYVIVPDKLKLYPDDAPAELQKLIATVDSYRSMIRTVRQSAGMTVIDLTEEMKSHTALESLYCQTDMMWTGFGSYVGYHSLITTISEKFGNVSVHSLADFTATTGENVGGELVSKLGLDGAVISETYLTIKPDFESRARYAQSGDGDAFNITQAFISYVDDPTLPVAIVTRDAYGTEMLANMSEHFSKMMVLGEGEFNISDEMIAEIKPDYIITISCNGELS